MSEICELPMSVLFTCFLEYRSITVDHSLKFSQTISIFFKLCVGHRCFEFVFFVHRSVVIIHELLSYPGVRKNYSTLALLYFENYLGH